VSYEVQKAELPPGDLGEDRCLQIGYYGHGDISLAAWNGPLEADPYAERVASSRFGLCHGSDISLFASLAGYLRRAGRSDEDVSSTLRTAGADILGDDPDNLRYYRNMSAFAVNRIANGVPLPRFDIGARSWNCLLLPTPTRPGVIEETGGTAIYTRSTGDFTHLVFAQILASDRRGGAMDFEIGESAEFCEQDVPVMARLICQTALGEYRRDIQAFLNDLDGRAV
jgi:hypothetical protein